MKIKQLRKLLAQLDPSWDDAEIASIVGRLPSGAKRVLAIEYRTGQKQIVINSMGTHVSEDLEEITVAVAVDDEIFLHGLTPHPTSEGPAHAV